MDKLLITFFIGLSCSPLLFADEMASNYEGLELMEASQSFCSPAPKGFGSTLSEGVVKVGTRLFDSAKRHAPDLKQGIGKIAHLANEGLDKVDPETLANVLSIAGEVGSMSASVLGALIGVDIPTSALDKLATYSTPDNIELAKNMAKGLTSVTETVFLDDPNQPKTNVEKAGEVVKTTAETVKGLVTYLIDNKGKIDKNEENNLENAIQEGIKLLTKVR